jgi:quercetin dioxygenase-like cupin family protein
MPFVQQNSLNGKEIMPGFNARFIHTQNITVGYVNIKAGSKLPEHAHIHEQVTHVLAGELEFTLAGETMVLKPGITAVIPSHVPHSAVALTDCVVLDIFQPVREDYR